MENGRLFATNYIRKLVDLNSIWDFSIIDDAGLKLDTMKMVVPSCWETHPSLASHRGRGVYSKKICFGGNVRFVFKGVSHTANIYLDGKHIGYHYNAYTAFDVVLTPVGYGEHLLEIQVDNSFHEASALHVENGYYSYTKDPEDSWCADLDTVGEAIDH